jgi:16S rRNA (cytidine1402-2'-O)-methyltransferase
MPSVFSRDVTINYMEKANKVGTLYIVATPIGNPKDITLRALDILKKVDAVICEEYRQGARLLHKIGVENNLLTLNEHNEAQEAINIVKRIQNGQTMALISDAGTPVFADPGGHLLRLIFHHNIPVSSIPGPSSLMTALSLCDFPIDRFYFAGFPPRKSPDRDTFLSQLKSVTDPIVLMDTPYRLTKLLSEVQHIFGGNQDILLACDLTLRKEAIFRGMVKNVLELVTGQKREFILILNRNR